MKVLRLKGENHIVFQCKKRSNKHDSSVSALKNIFFEASKFGLGSILIIIYFFSINITNYDFLIREISWNGVQPRREIILDWLPNCCEVCIYWFDESYDAQELLGGEDVVEIDESKIGKRKYNRRRLLEEMEQEIAKYSCSLRRTKKHVLSLPKTLVEENDDDSETLELDKEQSVASDLGMTQQQLMAHYAVCMKLAAENKITTKNAFSLNLIDVMKYVIKCEDEDRINFSAAGSAIDASSRIYSCRVDNLYSQGTRLVGGLGYAQDKSPGPSLPKGCQEETYVKSKKHKIIANRGQLQRLPQSRRSVVSTTLVEDSSRTSLMEAFPLTRPSEGMVLQRCQPFWPEQCGEPDQVAGTVTIRPHKYAPKHRPISTVQSVTKVSCKAVNPCQEELVDSDEVSIAATSQDSTVQLLCTKLKDNECEAAVVGVDQLLLTDPQQSDYHYLDSRWFRALYTPPFWHFPTSYTYAESTTGMSDSMSVVTIFKKNPRSIVYDRKINTNLFKKKWRKSNMYKAQHWKQEVLLFVDEVRLEKDIRRLFCCNLMLKVPKDRHHSLQSSGGDPSGVPERSEMISKDVEDHELPEDSGIFDTSVSSIQNMQPFEDSGMVDQRMFDSSDVITNKEATHSALTPTISMSVGLNHSEDESCSETSLLVGENLVPAPNKVTVPPIYYTLKPKRIDMKELKDTFWQEIQREQVEKGGSGAEGGVVTFRQLLRCIKEKMAPADSEALSWQLAMSCLLHLASEKLLELKQTDMTDFSIHFNEEPIPCQI